MKVSDVMTKDVVIVSTRTPLKDVARLLIARGISGVPVVDEDGSVLGVVSEGGHPRQGAKPRELPVALRPPTRGRRRRQQHDARDAADAMTTPAVVIRPDRPVAEAAAR